MALISKRRLILAAALAGAAFASPALAAEADCTTEKLQALAPPDTTVAFAAREGSGCRVHGWVTNQNPGPNRVLWMLMLPDNFNGRYLYQGVGGPAGQLPSANTTLLRQGYALAGSDAGTGPRAGGDFNFGGVPGREEDFLWRGVHTSAQATQQIARRYYARDKMYRYISGCSGGGAMALTNAFRFGREDFDGFLGAAVVMPGPSVYMPFLFRLQQRIQANPQAWISPELLAKGQAAIMARYDTIDGAADGIIADPRAIERFDDAVLAGVGFTPAQIETFRFITAPPPFPSFPKYPGGDAGGYPLTTMGGWSGFLLGRAAPPWPDSATATVAQVNASGAPYSHSMLDSRTRGAFPGLDYRTVRDPAELMRVATREGRDQINPSVDVFEKMRAAGGKMIFWHGVNDPNAIFNATAVGAKNVRARFADADSFFRMYPVPGMGHCGGGNGPTEVELPLLDALTGWVEQGKAPESIVATRTTPARGIEREFRLCPDPSRAHLKAPGLDFTKAENWECRAGQASPRGGGGGERG